MKDIYKEIINELNNIITENYKNRYAKSYHHELKAFDDLIKLENKYNDNECVQFFRYDNEVFSGSTGILLHRPETDIVEVIMFNQNSNLFFFNLHLSHLNSLNEVLLRIKKVVDKERNYYGEQ